MSGRKDVRYDPVVERKARRATPVQRSFGLFYPLIVAGVGLGVAHYYGAIHIDDWGFHLPQSVRYTLGQVGIRF